MTLRGYCPRCLRDIPFASTFTTTHGVIDRVHRDSAHSRPNSFPTHSTCFSFYAQVMFGIGDDTECGKTVFIDHPHFARGHPDRRIAVARAISCAERPAERTSCPPLPRTHLDVVHDRTKRHFFKSHATADVKRGPFTGLDSIAYFDSMGSEDIPLFSIHIMKQGNIGTAVGVIFDGGDFCGNAHLIAAKINQAQLALMASPAMPAGNTAEIITPTRASFWGQEAVYGVWMSLYSWEKRERAVRSWEERADAGRGW